MLERIRVLAKESDVVVGIGSARPGDAAEATTAEAPGSTRRGGVSVYREPHDLVNALTSGAIQAAVRGTFGSHEVIPPLLESTGSHSAMRVAMLVPDDGRAFLLAPVGIDEGRTGGERWELLVGSALLLSSWGVKPMVRVMSKGRPEDVGRGEDIARSQSDCEALRARAVAEGIDAECTGILVERAVATGNVALAPDGVSGNLIFRSLHHLGRMQSWGAVALGILPFVYVDTSRDKGEFSTAVTLARALTMSRQG
jgi:predicted methyltransferase MtxX (methanogen marker protein 4)